MAEDEGGGNRKGGKVQAFNYVPSILRQPGWGRPEGYFKKRV